MKMTRRNFISTSAATMLACGVSLSAHAAGSESENGLNFITDIFSDPAKPGTTQDATPLTAEKNAEWYSKLDFSDRREFGNAERGMLDNAEETIIYNDDGTTAWDLPSYGDLSGDAPDTVNPSLWRNTQLNAKAGLYEVCNGIYVQIPKGKITSIIGPNGCGKSTLLKALSRMMPVQSGAVLLDGQAIATLPTVEVARKMAILPQSPQAPGGLTVEELVSYGRYPHQKGFGKLNEDDHRAIAWALEITHMAEFAQRGIDALSGGQRQRAWIAMALAQDTPLILLDEPTTYLDMAHQLEVLELLKELNTNAHKTIALVIHDLNLAARFSDWMIAMRKGEVLYRGTPKEIMTNQVLRDVFSLDAYIAQDPWTGRPICMTYRLCIK